MFDVILVDDEQPALDELSFLLANQPDIRVEATFLDSLKALEHLMLHPVDAVFLDISMPRLDGFALAEALMRLKNPPQIIFSTAYEEYAVKAFEVNAIDYLLKPVTDERLETTLHRLREHLAKKGHTTARENGKKKLEQLMQDRGKEHPPARLALWKSDCIHLVRPQEIIYLESSEGKTILHTDQSTFISSETLGHFQMILPNNQFFRCHRSFIIQLDRITLVQPWFNNTYAVKMDNSDETIPVSRRNIHEFKERLHIE